MLKVYLFCLIFSSQCKFLKYFAHSVTDVISLDETKMDPSFEVVLDIFRKISTDYLVAHKLLLIGRYT